MKLILFVELLYYIFAKYHACGCLRSNSSDCCYGFMWNSTERKCLPCKIGFFGPACGDHCPAPLFGEQCSMQCNCSDKQCHHMYGCRTSNGTTADSTEIKQIYTTIKRDLTSMLHSELINQKDYEEQEQTTYVLKMTVVVLTAFVFTLFASYIYIIIFSKKYALQNEMS